MLMWDIKRLLNTKNKFIGIISSGFYTGKNNLIDDNVKGYFKNGGGLIIICSKRNEEQCIKYYEGHSNFSIINLFNNSRFAFIFEDSFYHNGRVDIGKLFNSIEKSLDLLKKRGATRIQIHITFDSSWNSIGNRNLKNIYGCLKKLVVEEKAGVIIRYLIEEINVKYFNYVLDNHDFILIDRTDYYECFTPSQLASQSLLLLTQSHVNEKVIEKDILKNEYLETLGEVVEGTIHDINNLLVTILGYAQFSVMLDDIEEIKEYLRIICKTASDGKNVINKVKNRIKGDYESLKNVYKFNHIINNCIDMVKHNFKTSIENGRELKLVVDLNSNGYVFVNEYDIRHAIINIVLNGIDAMKDGGVLTIRTFDIRDNIVLEISDTGIGMDEGTKSKIFKPYFTTKGSQGTGLGLSIAKKAFDKHNGRIYVESKLGEGTKFTIYLPTVSVKDNIAYI